jgi:mannose-1-phosphate guanylyltransferase
VFLNQQAWAVILAGGEGTRLRSLTRVISGEDCPKQFCPLLSGQTLLARTRSRLVSAVPPERTIFVVVKAHEKFYRRELADVEPVRIVVQPASKGTAAAVICSLQRVTGLAGDPVVAFFPTDHYYSDEGRFIASLDQAIQAALHHPDTLIVLGAKAERSDVDYGWIEPGTPFESRFPNALHRVSRFWEKPSHPTAKALLARGCLWNTFVMVGRASIFLALIEKHLAPGIIEVFMAAQRCACEVPSLAAENYLWARLGKGDFSRQVLSASTENLAVLKIGDVGWSDLGTPERVRVAMLRSNLKFGLPSTALSNSRVRQFQEHRK